ncbi:hypothetical protein [Actinokineospora bangkokensis]|nr:hypothetical protein [Actinokineospora bangkokensis]
MRTTREPTFLPLTLTTSRTLDVDVHWAALRADAAAAEAWAALLAGCANTGRHQLPRRLRELHDAAAALAAPAATGRTRVTRELARITEAVTDRDGADFAEAFVAYDQAVATVLAQSRVRTESTTR